LCSPRTSSSDFSPPICVSTNADFMFNLLVQARLSCAHPHGWARFYWVAVFKYS
jgi:hypothetical protein